jgi:hypothetical protein
MASVPTRMRAASHTRPCGLGLFEGAVALPELSGGLQGGGQFELPNTPSRPSPDF